MADPNALYSYQGQEPQPLPHEIHYTEAWGGTNFRQGVETFTDEEIARAGYSGPYEVPEYNQQHQRVFWNQKTLSYEVEDISVDDHWSEIRKKRNQLLSECDWVMVSDVPGNVNNIKEWEKYRQRLRDITSFDDPKTISWPIAPNIEGILFDAEPIEEIKLRHRVEDLEMKLQALIEVVNTLTSTAEGVKETDFSK